MSAFLHLTGGKKNGIDVGGKYTMKTTAHKKHYF